mmetsp:Transcript_13627/g.19985  ORF Transcript_13627/g.19985 Transcript_13627/m.19985 type:complete len:376 (-) Transcript_13627:353-1480(-)
MLFSKTIPLWNEMADESVVGLLDILFSTLTFLCLLHAVSKRGICSGIAVVVYLFLHTMLFEHTSLFLGGTRCHATSPLLPMITPCSSINSVLFYIPWLYTSIESARRMDLNPICYPFVVGFLVFGFGTVYEMQGPLNNFWKWPDDSGHIAQTAVILSSWEGYPHFEFLRKAQTTNEVAVVSSEGIFHVSDHARDALSQRLYGFPLFAPYFHFAYGFAWALVLSLTGNVKSGQNVSVLRLIVAGLCSPLLFLLPIWFTQYLSDVIHQPLLVAVPLSLALSVLPILILSKKDPQNSKALKSSSLTPDFLLFVISLNMHVFFVTFPWYDKAQTPLGLHVLVACVAAVHLIIQYYSCFTIAGKQIFTLAPCARRKMKAI